MKLKVISIGHLKNNPILEIQKDYESRISSFSKSIGIKSIKIKELPISKNHPLRRGKKKKQKKFLNTLRKKI